MQIAVVVNPLSLDKSYVINYLEAIEKYAPSNANLEFFTATMQGRESFLQEFDFSRFNAVIITFHIRPWLKNWGNPKLCSALHRFRGHKILILHDEYDQTNLMKKWILDYEISEIFTIIPEDSINKVYEARDFGHIKIETILTAAMPLNMPHESSIPPIAERTIDLVYRGRKPNPWMGRLVQEKYKIGEYFRENNGKFSLTVDLESSENERIYGKGWFDFLMSGKATLGTESGCNVFDVDGKIREWFSQNPELDSANVPSELNFKERNLGFETNQISPKIFEAAACKTALVLYNGNYSGVLKPYEHFIPLEKNHSNIEKVVKLLKDDNALQSMVDRTYQYLTSNPDYHYKALVAKVFDRISRFEHIKPTRPNAIKAARGVSLNELVSHELYLSRVVVSPVDGKIVRRVKKTLENFFHPVRLEYFVLAKALRRQYYLIRGKFIRGIKTLLRLNK